MISQLLNAEWLPRFSHFNKLIVGFSGGLDSTVLLHVLASYPLVRDQLIAVHINHGISTHSDDWQEHCKQFCYNLGIHFISQSVQFDRSANIEEEARLARYGVFSSLMKAEDCLVLGHHLADQAETVLLQLFRGAGVDGLAAMMEFGQQESGFVARPFLNYSREQLEHYAALHQLRWIDDESNQDIHYSRNYLRHQIIPLLKSKWSGVEKTIARTATHCQQARTNLDALAVQDCPGLSAAKNRLFIEPLLGLNPERIANILRVWLKKNQGQLPSTLTFNRLINEMIYSAPDAVPEVRWGNVVVRRYQHYLYFDEQNEINLPSCIEWTDFPEPLVLDKTGISFSAKKADKGLLVFQDATIEIRFRQGGECFFLHGQTKKLKKLFQEWGIPSWIRENIPLIYINNSLAAVVGYAVSDLFFTEDSSQAWLISAS